MDQRANGNDQRANGKFPAQNNPIGAVGRIPVCEWCEHPALAVNGFPDQGHGHLAEATAALALNALTGRERAEAVEHLQHCGSCRARVDAMALTSDDLLRLLPGLQPPSGFSARVTGQLQRDQGQPGRSRIRAALASAAIFVMVVAGGLAGWGLAGWRLGGAPGPASPAAAPVLRSAALVTAAHQRIGTVFLHVQGPNWMFVTVDADAGNTTVTCQLTTSRTGRFVTLGTFKLLAGDGYWGSPVPGQSSAVAGARLVTSAGTVLATAWFAGL